MAERELDGAADFDEPIPYMQRTRSYYAAIGYTIPYQWAHETDAPFTKPRKPLSQSRVAIITTAALFDAVKGDQGPGATYNSAAKFYQSYAAETVPQPDVRISHVAYDRTHTLADDSNTWFPLPALKRLVGKGRIGEVAPRFFGAPTNRSHRVTIETDAPQLLDYCRADHVDAVVLIPNCPVCHQTVSLVARHIEANGIPTVIAGCAKDIVEHAAVPRFVFSDFPLGNSAGKPHDIDSQDLTLDLALGLLESASAPLATIKSPLRWSDDASWKRDYNNVAHMSADELARRRRDFDAQKAIASAVRDSAA